jgi:uncharacterized protein YcaQ
MQSWSWAEVCRWRLARHYLSAPAPADGLVDVVRAVGGVQAQILSAAELAIGARVAGGTQQDVRAALWERRTLVKTYGPRTTLHLLPADELPLWMAAMQAREALSGPPWYAAAGLTPAQAKALLAAIGDALDGRGLPRAELAAEVARRAGAWAEQPLNSAWGELLAPAAFAGRLCFGPSQGSKVTFVRADQWIGGWQEVDPAAALREVCRRYLAAYGPATPADFGHWFALKPDAARGVLESLGAAVEEVSFDGRRAWMLAADGSAAPDLPPPETSVVRLLPQYDCYVIGSGPRDRVVPAPARARAATHGRGKFEGATGLPVLLIDGVVAGLWERRPRGKRLAVRVEPLAPLPPAQADQVAAEAARLAAFLDTPVDLTLGALD